MRRGWMQIVLLASMLAAALLLLSAAAGHAQQPGAGCGGQGCNEVIVNPGCPGNCNQEGGGGGGSSQTPGDSGSNSGNAGGQQGGGQQEACPTSVDYQPVGNGMCKMVLLDCHGRASESVPDRVPCPDATVSERRPICDRYEFSDGRLTCVSSCFGVNLRASVPFPGNCIDLRPYPVTMVNWDSAARYSCASSRTGTTYVDFVGSGTINNPRDGDWRNVRFSLTLYPMGIAYAWLPNAPLLKLPLVNEITPPVLFKFTLPSHPAAGANRLASTVPGFDEAPGDMPVFTGQVAAAYGLRWSLTYEEYDEVYEEVCVRGPKRDSNGGWVYDCKTNRNLRWNDGHKELRLVETRWIPRSLGGVIPASMINMPPEMRADLNGDGVADAIWNRNFVIRRMNDINRVDDPVWRRQWSFGGLIYWGVRDCSKSGKGVVKTVGGSSANRPSTHT